MTALTREQGYTQGGHVAVEPDLDSREWWSQIRAGRFTLPLCGSCGHRWFPPVPRCPRCASRDVALADASTRGKVSTWIVVHHALDPAFVEDTPYTIVAVELDDGARMFGRFMGDTAAADGLVVEARTYNSGDDVLVGFAAV